jgi:hypothetical protein
MSHDNADDQPDPIDVRMAAALPAVADVVEDCIEEIAGGRYGFALFVFPFDREDAHGTYVSNATTEGVAVAIEALHKWLQARLPTVALNRRSDTQ